MKVRPMDDYFYIQFLATEQTGQMLIQDAQSLSQLLQHLQSAMSNLYASGLQGAFLDELQARADYIFNTLRYFCDKSDEAGQELMMVVRIMRELDAEWARRFDSNLSNFLASPPSISVWQDGLTGDLPNYQLPDFIRQRIDQEYSLVNGLNNFNKITGIWTPMGIPADIIRWAAIKGAGQLGAMTTTQEGFERVISAIRNPMFGRTVVVGMGVADGIADWYFSENHSATAFATQTISGGVQGIIGLTPLGRGILVADAATQLIGHGTSQLIEDNALWLANGDSELAQEFVQTADNFQNALNAASLDARMDGMVNAIITGDAEAFGEEIITGFWGVGGIVVEGAKLGDMTMNALGQNIADNTQLDEFIGGMAARSEDAINGLFSLFS